MAKKGHDAFEHHDLVFIYFDGRPHSFADGDGGLWSWLFLRSSAFFFMVKAVRLYSCWSSCCGYLFGIYCHIDFY